VLTRQFPLLEAAQPADELKIAPESGDVATLDGSQHADEDL
jgi:hypothetical protein